MEVEIVPGLPRNVVSIKGGSLQNNVKNDPVQWKLFVTMLRKILELFAIKESQNFQETTYDRVFQGLNSVPYIKKNSAKVCS